MLPRLRRCAFIALVVVVVAGTIFTDAVAAVWRSGVEGRGSSGEVGWWREGAVEKRGGGEMEWWWEGCVLLERALSDPTLWSGAGCASRTHTVYLLLLLSTSDGLFLE
jgi:hypothetical protein